MCVCDPVPYLHSKGEDGEYGLGQHGQQEEPDGRGDSGVGLCVVVELTGGHRGQVVVTAVCDRVCVCVCDRVCVCMRECVRVCPCVCGYV